MVPRDRNGIESRKLLRVGFAIVCPVERTSEGTFQQALVSDAGRAAMLAKLYVVSRSPSGVSTP
jgi:hypothetical protein